jgi:hypothetical protein
MRLISVSAHGMASLMGVPPTALANMIGIPFGWAEPVFPIDLRD